MDLFDAKESYEGYGGDEACASHGGTFSCVVTLWEDQPGSLRDKTASLEVQCSADELHLIELGILERGGVEHRKAVHSAIANLVWETYDMVVGGENQIIDGISQLCWKG